MGRSTKGLPGSKSATSKTARLRRSQNDRASRVQLGLQAKDASMRRGAARGPAWSANEKTLDACTDEVLLHIACFISDANALLCFALTCSRLGARTVSSAICASDPSDSRPCCSEQSVAMETWSLVDEAARRWLRGCSDEECGQTPRRGRDTWMSLMNEVQRLRSPSRFVRVHKSIRMKLEEGGHRITKKQSAQDGNATRTAASTVVMRAGRHFVQFRMRDEIGAASTTCVGVVRPTWNIETGFNAQYRPEHCFFRCADGKAFPGYRDWAGMPFQSTTAAGVPLPATSTGECIGLLLDLDRGVMIVYKDGRPLGVVATGLSGEYCWAVATAGVDEWGHDSQPPGPKGILRIESAPTPAPIGESLEAWRT